jgi:hypothetical protein
MAAVSVIEDENDRALRARPGEQAGNPLNEVVLTGLRASGRVMGDLGRIPERR